MFLLIVCLIIFALLKPDKKDDFGCAGCTYIIMCLIIFFFVFGLLVNKTG